MLVIALVVLLVVVPESGRSVHGFQLVVVCACRLSLLVACFGLTIDSRCLWVAARGLMALGWWSRGLLVVGGCLLVETGTQTVRNMKLETMSTHDTRLYSNQRIPN